MSLLKYIKLDSFVVLDLETTGLDPTSDRIIEIGALRYTDGKEAEKFETFVNPGVPIPDFITKLTGISDSDVQDAPVIDNVFDGLIDFLGESPIIGHQINFDCSFLEYLYRIKNNNFDQWDKESQRFVYLKNRRMDTLFLARIFLPFLQQFRLGSVASHFGIDLENAHRALDDARATGKVFLELIDRTLACDTQVLRQIIRLLYKNSARVKHFFKPILDYKLENNIKVTNAGITEDVTYAQNFFNIIGEADYKREMIDEEVPLELIDEEQIIHTISGDGSLKNTLNNFEQRPEQENMARLVAQTFNNKEFLVVEAGTGTGKSIAYLFPAVEWAVKNRENNERVLISTNTKNLQEQLFFKDIPTVYATSPNKFKTVLLKGKSNYLCLDRWKTTIVDMDQRLSSQERVRILPLMLWAEQTQTGDIAENAGFQLNQNWGLWGKLIAENNYCPGRTCKFYQECFLMRARNNARKADIVVVNHSLLFSDLVTDNSILGTYNNLIVDEAHNLEKTAGDYLGVRFNWWSFRNIYHKLYEEEPKKAGSLVQLEYRISQIRLPDSLYDRMTKQISRVKTESLSFKHMANQFFSALNQNLREKYQGQNQNGFEETRIRYHKKFRFFTEISETIDDLKRNIATLRKAVSQILDIFNDIRADSFQFQDQIHREFISFEMDLQNLSESLEFCINANDDSFVYWLELPTRKTSNDVNFNAVPLNVAELLKKTLYQQLNSAVFTSATLAVNDSFSYYKDRVGLNLVQHVEVKSAILGSPFDYNNQLSLFVLDFFDDPRNERFTEQLSNIIQETHRNHPKGMLVLFTNYSVLNKLYSEMKSHFEMEKILLLAQGKSGSRTNIINQFREFKNSILFGTDSFWEGVDVPGDALELLLITKLPFDVPSEPLIAAKMEKIKRSGGNPFIDFSVPEAVIKFRQGFGRLIRHKNDYGAVLVCDNRLSRMQYGQQFLNSLPVDGHIIKDKDNLFTELETWFTKKVLQQGKYMRTNNLKISSASLTMDEIHNFLEAPTDINIDNDTIEKINKSRQVIESILDSDNPVYGVNTGFGNFSETRIETKTLGELQRRLVLSHAAGVGNNVPLPIVRLMMLLKIKSLSLGYSGCRYEIIDKLSGLLMKTVLPLIPEQGSVGASGDLAPLAHMALVLLGEGSAFIPADKDSDDHATKEVSGSEALVYAGIEPVILQAKEGLAILNGTQAMTAYALFALNQTKNLLKVADIVGAVSVEALLGTLTPFDVRIQQIRNHPGQLTVAENIRTILTSSPIVESHKYSHHKVQDAYSLRCIPQVHGAVRDTATHTESVLLNEANGVTDNPLVFPDNNEVLSGGNFHGAPVAQVSDFLSIALTDLSSISERRIEHMLDPSVSQLPAFLTSEGGLNSGFMIAHVTSASLVSENKSLSHPSSTDSIPTSANKEDHVSMGMHAARKLLQITQNLEYVLAIELLCACQALEFRSPLQPAKSTSSALNLVREKIPTWSEDRFMQKDILIAKELINNGKLVAAVERECGLLS